MKPIVIISPSEGVSASTGRPYYFIRRSYAMALTGAGAVPMLAADARLFEDYASLADGLLLSDGILNINPGRYGEAVNSEEAGGAFGFPVQPSRDSMDLALCKAFIKANKPVLGIGRGMHILNVALGGTLIQTLDKDQQLKHNMAAYHGVKTEEGSLMQQIIGSDAAVFSMHHQAVNKPGKGLKISALSSDGMAEAIESEEGRLLGVQWNPELKDTEDLAMYLDGVNKVKAEPLSKEEREEKMKYTEHKRPVPGVPTDIDAVRPADNPLFNYFVSLCGGEKSNEE